MRRSVLSPVCSIFSQLLAVFPRLEFQQAVKQHRAERHARGFSCWSQFVAMLFCQLGKAQTLREICWGLRAQEGKLRHLGLAAPPKRSTLAYANEHRPWELYQTVFGQLFEKCQSLVGPRKKFRFKNRLLSIDGTIIDLCIQVFDWAHFRRTKGGVKIHMVLDHDGYLPSFAIIAPAKKPEVHVVREMKFEPGTILVVDRGYTDYRWYEELTQAGVFFVTRMRWNAYCEVVEERTVSGHGNVLRDQIVRIGHSNWRQKSVIRRVEVWDDEKNETISFLTNNLKLAASTIAEIYRDRWQIEIFFRALKQSLRVKTFVGTSANALKTQIWTALIAMLLLKYLQLRASFGWSLSNLVALLRQQLCNYRDLWVWLNTRPDRWPDLPEPCEVQLSLGV